MNINQYPLNKIIEKANMIVADAKKDADDEARGGNERLDMANSTFIRGMEKMLNFFLEELNK